jgi:hypothetical protein
MLEAQQEFDQRAGPMCPEQLTAPVLHSVLTHPAIQVRTRRWTAGSGHTAGCKVLVHDTRIDAERWSLTSAG